MPSGNAGAVPFSLLLDRIMPFSASLQDRKVSTPGEVAAITAHFKANKAEARRLQGWG